MFELIRESGGRSMANKWVRLTLCILQVGDVDPRVDSPVPADVFYMGTPGRRPGVSNVEQLAARW